MSTKPPTKDASAVGTIDHWITYPGPHRVRHTRSRDAMMDRHWSSESPVEYVPAGAHRRFAMEAAQRRKVQPK